MSDSQSEDRLLQKLLALAEPGDPAPPAQGEHPDEELLALFAAGDASHEERLQVAGHLADCPTCRRVVAELLRLAAEETAPAARPIMPAARPDFRNRPRLMMALAAGLLLAITLAAVYWPAGMTEQTAYLRAREQLIAGRFAETRATIDAAQRLRIASDRLRSLDAQAIRQIPDPIALATAGKLSDFGYDIGGIAARDPESTPYRTGLREADRQLGAGDSAELELLLNRGHLHLTKNDLDAAEGDFAAAARLAPENALVPLGQGLVAFFKDDLPAAEAAFRRALALDPASHAARINLAMTLQEQDKLSEARRAWEALLEEDLPDAERAKIEAVLNALPEPLP